MVMKMPSIFVKNARFLVTIDQTRRIIRDGSIAIDDGKIIDIGKTDKLQNNYGSSEIIIDAARHVIMPGLINTHCHTNHHLARGLADNVLFPTWIHERVYPFESTMNEHDVYLAAMACCIESIKTGSTCFIDPGGYNMEHAVKAVDESGMRAVLSRSAVDIHSDARAIPGKMREDTDNAANSSEQFVREYNGAAGGRVHAWFAPRTERMASTELLQRIKELAVKYETGITIHASSTQDSVLRHKEIFNGERPIERFNRAGLLGQNLLVGEANWLTDEEVSLIQKYDVKVFHIPTGSFHGAYGALQSKHLDMIKKGIAVGLGHDSAAESNFLDMFRVMYSVIARRDVNLDPTLVPPEQILEMATINGARTALWENEIGSLEPGKRADLIIIDTMRPEWLPLHNPISNLVHSASGDSVSTVIIDGKVVMRDRIINTVDEQKMLMQIDEAGLSISERSGVSRYAIPRWPIS